MEKRYTLYELNRQVRQVVETELNGTYWVEAELSEVRESRGHCYMELVEYRGGQPEGELVARASARCWRSVWQLLRPHFERITGEPLHAGMKVLLLVSPQFHEQYGFSWMVNDINPEYTVGDRVRRRQEIIRQLKSEGVFDLQRELPLPLFAQRIAVISSATAAGYGDFCNQLADNPYGFCFQTQLFPAVMQGEQVETSVIAALNQIYDACSNFDVVVIIRGGGATTDLSGFDTLALAENVANFPLPVLTGIGHDRDESILDMVAHTRVKTPTAAAAFLIDHLLEVAERLERLEKAVADSVGGRLLVERQRLERLSQLIPRLPTQLVGEGRRQSALLEARLQSALSRLLDRRRHALAVYEAKLPLYDPQRLLQRGYSITLHAGRVVRDAKQLSVGDEIETRLATGSVRSVVGNSRD